MSLLSISDVKKIRKHPKPLLLGNLVEKAKINILEEANLKVRIEDS